MTTIPALSVTVVNQTCGLLSRAWDASGDGGGLGTPGTGPHTTALNKWL